MSWNPDSQVTQWGGLASESVNTRLHGHLVRCRGIVRRLDGDASSGRFHLLSDGHLVAVDMQGLAADRHVSPDDGAKIEVTGLLLLEFENIDDYASLPVFRRFTLIPRYSAEIRTIEQAPWWTAARLLVVISILILVLIAFAVWNRLLHALSERRGRELFRARFERIKAESTLTPRQREVLNLVAKGFSNKEIGRLLGTGEDAIKKHLKTIYAVINVANRAEATSYAIANKLIEH